MAAGDASTRLNAALAIGSNPEPSLVDTLIARCAVEPDFYVRDMLTWALTRLPSEITVPRLLAELCSKCAHARSQALHTLSKIKDANARCESLMKTLKREEIYANDYVDLDDLRGYIEEFIERYYNQKRLHSALGYRTPEEFEMQTGGKSEAELQSATLRFFAKTSQRVSTALAGEGTQTPSLPHTPALLGESTR